MSSFALVFRALVSGPARRHPVRVLIPALGVGIGVAAVAAIHHANRSISESFREAAFAVSGRSVFVVKGAAGVPVADLAPLSFLWRIGSFAPAVTGTAVVDDGTREIARILGIDWGGDGAIRDLRLVGSAGGTARARLFAADAVLVSTSFASRHGLSPGSRLPLVVGGRRRTVTVAGLLALEGLARASGSDTLVTDIFTAQALLGREGFVDRVDIVLHPGVSPAATAREIRRRLAPGLVLESPGREAETARRMVRAFRFNLNALGSLTLLVGIFLVANAVSIAVLRRRPEIATLRALGAARGSIFAAFFIEGLAIGVAGTALGEVLGLFVSRVALSAVAGTVSSIYLPSARIAGSGYGGAIALAAAVGMAASVAAALLPALEATRVAPSPAMRPGSIEGVARRRLGPRGALALFLLAGAALATRIGPIDGFPFFGFAAVGLVVAAVAMAAPLAVRAGATLPGRLLGERPGAAGLLARSFFGGALTRNGIAVTALAVALGMTLAMIVTVSSIRETVRVWVGSTLSSDLWVKAEAGGRPGILGDLPAEIVPWLQAFPGVAAVDPFRARETTDPSGHPFTLASGDFRVVARVGGLPLLGGADPGTVALAARRSGQVLVSEPFARRFGVDAGSRISLATPAGPRSFGVAGVYRDYSNDRGTVMMDRGLYLSLFHDPRVTSVAVLADPGVDPNALRRSLLSGASERFALSISTNRELRREALAIFDRTFAVTRALETIAIGVAVLGIANALVASAVERRRSFGLLRAIGASGDQIRRATLGEAALAGLVGTCMAALAGGAFAWLLLSVINPQSFGWTVALRVPLGLLAGACALVAFSSLLAGILPGRIAAAVEPAAALQEE